MTVALSVASKHMLDSANTRFSECPGGQPRDLMDFGAILVLSAFGEISASVRLERLQFPPFTFTEERKWQLGHWFGVQAETLHSDRLIERGGPGDTMGSRVQSLWNQLQSRRNVLALRCTELSTELEGVLPEGLALDPHQLEALVQFDAWGHRMLLADDMGLGKTVSTLAAVARYDALPAFVVCPASMTHTWVREAKKWLAPMNPDCHIVTKGFVAKNVDRDRAFVVASYEQMVGYQREIARLKPDFFISDESHYLMRWESQRTKAALRLRAAAHHRLALTGTGMPNGRHREIYPQIKILDSRAFAHIARGQKSDRYAYLRRYCDPKVQHFGKRHITKYDGRSNEEELGRLLQGYMLRRTKKEVNLPGLLDKTRNAIEVPLPPSALLRMATMKDDIARNIRDKADVLREQMELRGFPEKIIEEKCKAILGAQAVTELAHMHSELGVIKAEWSVTRVREHLDAGHRVLVFAYHHKVAQHAERVYSKAFGAKNVRMATGALAGKARDRFLEKIKAGEGKVVILTRAFREGLTLISFTRGIMLQRWWVPGEEAQAEDRIYRRGQLFNVSWDYLVISGTMDDAMAELITWKEKGQQQSYGSMESRALKWLTPELAA